MSTKKPGAVAEVSNEPVTKIKSYTISSEMDSNSATFDKALKNLKREFGFDMESEIFDIDDL